MVPRRPASAGPTGGPTRRKLVVCGDDPLAHRLIEELVNRYRAEVTAILPSRRRNHGPEISRIPGVRVVEADRLDIDAFRQAKVSTAHALALVKQDDVGNIHAALQAQELNAELRLVIRMFNTGLGHGIGRMLNDCAVLSDASMAAPAFVSAALGEFVPVHVRLPGRNLYVASRAAVRPHEVVCGLAVTGADRRSELLPSDQSRADLVLAVTNARSPGPGQDGDGASPMIHVIGEGKRPNRWRGSRRGWWKRWWRRQRGNPFGVLRTMLNRKLRLAALALVACIVVGTGVLAAVRGIPWWDAAYLTILTAFGGANPDLGVGGAEKITQTALTVFSIALIPVLTATFVEAVVNARLALALGRLKTPMADHVVVVGLGNVGTRVIRQLHALGIPVVAVDKSASARGVQAARELGIPFIEADASEMETLRAASIETSRALLCLSTDDVTNLEAGLHARTLQRDIRVVLRLFDGDFADRVQRAFGIHTSRSVSFLAAPAFAAAMLEREVIGTIPVDRKVLLIAEAPVCPGSELDGAPVSSADDVGEVRAIAMVTDSGAQVLWSPPGTKVMLPGDVLIVVATREGLGRILAKTGGTASRPADEPVVQR